MKRVVFIILLLLELPSLLIAQEKDSIFIPLNDRGLAEYSEVILLDSMSKDDLYISALEWVTKTYKSAKNVIQTADKDEGIIIGKAITSGLIYNNMGFKVDAGYFLYTIAIYCRDNRYKYVIDNIIYNRGEMGLKSGADLAEDFPSNWTGVLGNNRQTRREWMKFRIQANLELISIINDLKLYMHDSSTKNNW